MQTTNELTYIARIKMKKLPLFVDVLYICRKYMLARVGSSIIRQMAAPNCVALAALVLKLCILEERHPVCDFEVTLCNIGLTCVLAETHNVQCFHLGPVLCVVT